MLPKSVHDPVPDLLICDCSNGVLAISQSIFFIHTEPLQEVVRTYPRVFDCLAFLQTDVKTEELICVAKRKPDNDVIWILLNLSYRHPGRLCGFLP